MTSAAEVYKQVLKIPFIIDQYKHNTSTMSFTKWLKTFPLIANKMKKKGRIGEIQILRSLFYGLVMKSSVAFANPSSTHRVDLGKKSLTQSAMQSKQQEGRAFKSLGWGRGAKGKGSSRDPGMWLLPLESSQVPGVTLHFR